MRNQPSSTNEKKKKIREKQSIHLHSQSPHDAEIIKKIIVGNKSITFTFNKRIDLSKISMRFSSRFLVEYRQILAKKAILKETIVEWDLYYDRMGSTKTRTEEKKRNSNRFRAISVRRGIKKRHCH